MRDQRQNSELLYEHRNKPKIEFDDLQNFANSKESIENQKSMNNKPVSVNQMKVRESPSPNSQQKVPFQKTPNMKQNVVYVEFIGMKLRLAIQIIVKFVSSIFIKLTCVT